YRPFLHVGGDPTLDLSLAPLDRGAPSGGVVAFDSGLGWRIVATADGWSFVGLRANRPYHALAVDREWRKGTVFLPARLRSGAGTWSERRGPEARGSTPTGRRPSAASV